MTGEVSRHPAPGDTSAVTDTSASDSTDPSAEASASKARGTTEPNDDATGEASGDEADGRAGAEYSGGARGENHDDEREAENGAEGHSDADAEAPDSAAAQADADADELAAADDEPQSRKTSRGKGPGRRSARSVLGRGRRKGAKSAKREGASFRRAATTTASVGAMAAIGLLAVGMTTPLGALAGFDDGANPAATTSIAAKQQDEKAPSSEKGGGIQAFVAPSDVKNAELVRPKGYESATFAEVADASGVSTDGAFFQNDPTADIQWPFAVGTSMSDGFGMRDGRMHEGVDFTPGDGAPIQAVAAGTVRTATESGGAYGVTVYIDHVIDGQVVTSHYAHMQYGSLQVSAGDTVEVGDVIGKVGNTGRSFGSHLHFEIIVDDATIDPLPWLEEHAGTHYPSEAEPQTLDEAVVD